ncbi:MAG: GAF domain-containing protein [Sulfuricellaceae bacterium]|nr:GAF domain-containing protein [Sulfuricellaceae bacterium]
MRQAPARSLNNSVISLKDELRKRDQQIALFKEVVNAVQNRLSLKRIFEMVAVFARNLIQAETVLIPVLDEDCMHYTYRAGSGLNAEEIVGESLHIDMGICGWVWRHNRPWWRGVLEELSEHERNRWEQEVGSVILVPLVGSNHFLGGIAGINKTGGRDFDKQDLDLLTLLASQIATAIDNNALIDQMEKANQTIVSEKVKAQVTLASIADAVITTDKQGLIDYLNPVAENLFGIPLSEARAKRPQELGTLLYERDRQAAMGLFEQSLGEGPLPSQFLNLILVRQDGQEFYIESTAAPHGTTLSSRDAHGATNKPPLPHAGEGWGEGGPSRPAGSAFSAVLLPHEKTGHNRLKVVP